VALRELRTIVAEAIAHGSRLDRIHHPDARWSGARSWSKRWRANSPTSMPRSNASGEARS
jgi:hypothetical protein